MNTSNISLLQLSNLSDLEMMKVIFSSGDYFPGFYKYTLGTLQLGEETLNIATLLFLALEEKIKKIKHSKEEWLEVQHQIYDKDIASESARNFNNSPKARALLNTAMYNWYFDEIQYDIFILNDQKTVKTFKKNTTYYFMGSLIRYTNNQLCIGYNHFLKTTVIKLNVSFLEVSDYLLSSFQTQWISDLFIYGEVIGELTFNPENAGSLKINEADLNSYLMHNSELKVLAVPSKSRHLPIRFAKHIRLSNFTRKENSEYQVHSNHNSL